MRYTFTLVLVCFLICACFADGSARDARRADYRILREWTNDEFAAEDVEIPEHLIPAMFTSGAIDPIPSYTTTSSSGAGRDGHRSI